MPHTHGTGPRDLIAEPPKIYPGAILWMPPGTPGVRMRGSDHPVVVLEVLNDDVRVALVTSTRRPFTSERNPWNIPLDCTPPRPDPVTGLLLKTTVLEGRPSMLYKQSYVCLEPFTIPKSSLLRLDSGTIEVELETSFGVLLAQVEGYRRGRQTPIAATSNQETGLGEQRNLQNERERERERERETGHDDEGGWTVVQRPRNRSSNPSARRLQN
ncbi:hypothetical protein DFH27DRAFT_601360 [Peziza echinospora]|nr:hypothetical protein DFH27DRAFT_601360 [Peziza echinospora]